MKSFGRILSVTAILSCLIVTQSAQASSVLDFAGLGPNNYDPIPGNYGSNLAGTPNIAVSYRTFDSGTDVTATPYLEYWNTGYGDLTEVAFASSNGYGAEIAFTPDAGYYVVLESFDLAGWPTVDRTAQYIRIVDSANNVLLDLGTNVLIAGAGGTHTSFAPNFANAGTLRLQFGNDWNIGIDNVRFSQRQVPEPAAITSLLIGAAFLVRRRFRAKS